MESYRSEFTEYIKSLQDQICATLEQIDGEAKFKEDKWERPGGGGGRTRVIENGAVIEKGGVNVSEVFGELPEAAQKQLGQEPGYFFACGISLVIHPMNPFAPTTHANFRYFEIRDTENSPVRDAWFGGGSDLTPYYLFEEDAIHFHQAQKDAADSIDLSYYPKYKAACDEYFNNAHRGERRGIGGTFFDYLKETASKPLSHWKEFTMTMGNSFLPSFAPILEKRKNIPYTEENKYWQEIRRGRYVEFNLIHDKGTIFGLRTNGRIESILMSLPATVRWDYCHAPKPNSEEERLLEVLKEPKDWI